MPRRKNNETLSSTNPTNPTKTENENLSDAEKRLADLTRIEEKRRRRALKKAEKEKDSSGSELEAKQQKEFEEIQKGFTLFVGKAMEVMNETLPKMIPNLFEPVEVSDTEKEIVGHSFSVYMERHKEEFIQNAPGYMLAGSLGMFFLPRLKLTKGKNESSRHSDNRKDGNGEIPPDSPVTPLFPPSDHS